MPASKRLVPEIKKKGQPFVDQPIVARPRMPTPVEQAVIALFNKELPPTITLGHQRVKLNWISP